MEAGTVECSCGYRAWIPRWRDRKSAILGDGHQAHFIEAMTKKPPLTLAELEEIMDPGWVAERYGRASTGVHGVRYGQGAAG